MELPEIKNTMSKMKYSLTGINRLDTSEKNISELEDIASETIQQKHRKNKRLKKIEQRLNDLWDNTKFNIRVMRVSENGGGR